MIRASMSVCGLQGNHDVATGQALNRREARPPATPPALKVNRGQAYSKYHCSGMNITH